MCVKTFYTYRDPSLNYSFISFFFFTYLFAFCVQLAFWLIHRSVTEEVFLYIFSDYFLAELLIPTCSCISENYLIPVLSDRFSNLKVVHLSPLLLLSFSKGKSVAAILILLLISLTSGIIFVVHHWTISRKSVVSSGLMKLVIHMLLWV